MASCLATEPKIIVKLALGCNSTDNGVKERDENAALNIKATDALLMAQDQELLHNSKTNQLQHADLEERCFKAEECSITDNRESSALDPSQMGGQEESIEGRLLHSSRNSSWWSRLTLEILLITLVLPFLLLGIFAAFGNGKSLEQHGWLNRLLEAAKYGPTFFPILFAVIGARFLKAIAIYELEKETTVQTMEQLMGSKTIISTIMTQVKLCSVNVLAAVLIIFWGCSPLGGQASLRVASVQSLIRSRTQTMQYVDFNTPSYAPYTYGFSIPYINSLYTSTLTTSAENQADSQALWGNIKIPMIESLDGLQTGDPQAWIHLDSFSNFSYAALLGLPATLLQPNNSKINMSFAFEAAYWNMNCTSFMSDTTTQWPPITELSDGHALFIAMNNTGRQSAPDLLTPWYWSNLEAHGERRFWFAAQSLIEKDGQISAGIHGPYFQARCGLSTTYVEATFFCASSACQCTAIRPSQLHHNISIFSMLDDIGASADSTFLQYWVNATNIAASTTMASTPNAGYLVDPSNPFGSSADFANWNHVTSKQFSIRLSQLFNTYWLSNLAYTAITGNLSDVIDANLSASSQLGIGPAIPKLKNTSAHISQADTVLICSIPWLIVLLLTSLILIAAAGVSCVLNLHRLEPDILDSFSTMIKGSIFVDSHMSQIGISTLDGLQRSKRLAKQRVQLGDFMPFESVGYIAIGSPRDGRSKKLQRNRLYR